MKRALGLFGLAMLTAMTLTAFAAGLGYPWEMFVHFRPHYAALALCGVVVLLVLGQKRLAVASAILAGVNIAAVASTPLARPLPATGAPVYRVLWLNSGGHNGALFAAGLWAERAKADLVIISELRPDQDDDLAGYFPSFGFRHHRGLGGGSDLVALTRTPADPIWRDGGGLANAIVSFNVRFADGQIATVTALHPPPPTEAWMKRDRDALLRAAYANIAATAGPHLMIGDFNATPWSPILREATQRAGLKLAGCGGLNGATWLSRAVFLGLPIDLAYANDGLAVRCAIAEQRQSDHYPILVELSGRAGPGPRP
jgi:endonuclease/exonuclease/phosphatase (EEP) superfamily protein YafD